MAVYNTTATAACQANTNDAAHVFDQKRATSGSNVAFSKFGSFYFQISPDSAKFINDVSFDISVVFTAQEVSALSTYQRRWKMQQNEKKKRILTERIAGQCRQCGQH